MILNQPFSSSSAIACPLIRKRGHCGLLVTVHSELEGKAVNAPFSWKSLHLRGK